MYWAPLYWLVVWLIASSDPEVTRTTTTTSPLPSPTNLYFFPPTTPPMTRPPYSFRPTTLSPKYYPAPSLTVDYRLNSPSNDYNDPSMDTAYRSRPRLTSLDMGGEAQGPASYYPRIPSVFRTDSPMPSYYTDPSRRIHATTWRPFVKVGPVFDFDGSGSDDGANYRRAGNYLETTESSTISFILDELNTEAPLQPTTEMVAPFYNPNVPYYPYPPEISIQIPKEYSRNDLRKTYNPFALTTLTPTISSITRTTITRLNIPQPFNAEGILPSESYYQSNAGLIDDAKKQLADFYTPTMRSRQRPPVNSWPSLDEISGVNARGLEGSETKSSASEIDLQRMSNVVRYPQPRNPLEDNFYAEGSSRQDVKSDENCPENPRVPRKMKS